MATTSMYFGCKLFRVWKSVCNTSSGLIDIAALTEWIKHKNRVTPWGSESHRRSRGVCVGLYVHGSTIFGNHRPKDLDLIAVVEDIDLVKKCTKRFMMVHVCM